MDIAAVLPHTKLFGGVKRYLELGNLFVDKGNSFTIYTPDGEPPGWFDFYGRVCGLSDLSTERHEAIFTSEEAFLGDILGSNSSVKIFYVISKNRALRKIAKHREITLFANSTNTYERIVRNTGKKPFKAFGGVNIGDFPDREEEPPCPPFTICVYGRQSMRLKGTHIVVKACERLYRKGHDIRLILFDTPVDEDMKRKIDSFSTSVPFKFVTNNPVKENHSIFGMANVFVSAERKGGWSNTCAEAMAAGLAVIGTKVGTRDFLFNNRTGLVVWRNSFSVASAIRRLMKDEKLRKRLAVSGKNEIRRFDWNLLAERILEYLSGRLKGR